MLSKANQDLRLINTGAVYLMKFNPKYLAKDHVSARIKGDVAQSLCSNHYRHDRGRLSITHYFGVYSGILALLSMC